MYKSFKAHKSYLENMLSWGNNKDGFKKLGEEIGMLVCDWGSERKELIERLNKEHLMRDGKNCANEALGIACEICQYTKRLEEQTVKENELREHAICSACNNKIGHTGLPIFWTLDIKRWGIDGQAIKRQSGLAMFLGSSELANVMGTNEDMASIILEESITLCETCATPILILLEQCKK